MILQGDALSVLKTLDTESVQCCVTSPPYLGLRDYGIEGQIGLEKTPEAYVESLVAVFREVRRVLRKDGTLWLNLGDSYWGGKGQSSQAWSTEHQERKTLEKAQHQITGMGQTRPTDGKHPVIKPKDLIGIPWMVAFALRADGWWLRQDIIWNKPNPMPESVTDRCTKSHEYIFLLTKSAKYFYDNQAIMEPAQYGEQHANKTTSWGTNRKHPNKANVADYAFKGDNHTTSKMLDGSYGRNRRSVWTITTKPFSEAHFATFPPELPEICIKAGTSKKGCCPKCGAPWKSDIERKANYEKRQDRGQPDWKGGQVDSSGWKPATVTDNGWRPTCSCNAEPIPCTVLDPFSGAGTTGLVADRLGRKYIGIELNPAYVKMSEKRIYNDAPLLQEG